MEHPHTLIIGGTRGIGRAFVKSLVGEGHAVSVIGRRPPTEPDQKIPGVNYIGADVSKEEELHLALSDLIRERGKPSYLVFLQRYRDTGDTWVGEFEVSVTATRNIIEAMAGSFSPEGDKSILVVSSVASFLIASEQPLSYHVAKAALVQLVRYYACTLGPKGIRANAVSLGTVLKEESRQFYEDNQELSQLYRDITPLGRMGTADEISQVIGFLCSPKASYITGQNITVDGGVSLQWHESLARRIADLDHLKVTRS